VSDTPLADAVHRSITEAFKAVPDGKRGALLVVADGYGARAMVAARFGSHWKVAAGSAVPWDGPITGVVAIEGSW
jgi:hypothetical protein